MLLLLYDPITFSLLFSTNTSIFKNNVRTLLRLLSCLILVERKKHSRRLIKVLGLAMFALFN